MYCKLVSSENWFGSAYSICTEVLPLPPPRSICTCISSHPTLWIWEECGIEPKERTERENRKKERKKKREKQLICDEWRISNTEYQITHPHPHPHTHPPTANQPSPSPLLTPFYRSIYYLLYKNITPLFNIFIFILVIIYFTLLLLLLLLLLYSLPCSCFLPSFQSSIANCYSILSIISYRQIDHQYQNLNISISHYLPRNPSATDDRYIILYYISSLPSNPSPEHYVHILYFSSRLGIAASTDSQVSNDYHHTCHHPLHSDIHPSACQTRFSDARRYNNQLTYSTSLRQALVVFEDPLLFFCLSYSAGLHHWTRTELSKLLDYLYWRKTASKRTSAPLVVAQCRRSVTHCLYTYVPQCGSTSPVYQFSRSFSTSSVLSYLHRSIYSRRDETRRGYSCIYSVYRPRPSPPLRRIDQYSLPNKPLILAWDLTASSPYCTVSSSRPSPSIYFKPQGSPSLNQ